MSIGLELLLLAGADPRIKNAKGEIPLDVLREEDPDHASRFLLEHVCFESTPSLVLKLRHQPDAARVVGAKLVEVHEEAEEGGRNDEDHVVAFLREIGQRQWGQLRRWRRRDGKGWWRSHKLI